MAGGSEFPAAATGESPETIYVRHNIGPHRPTSDRVDWADEHPKWCEYFDEWAITAQAGVPGRLSVSIPAPETYRRLEPWPSPAIPITVVPAKEVADTVLRDVGATPPRRDALDQKVIDDYHTGTGAIGQRSDWPALESGTPYADGDRDGMADQWETRHGFAPESPTDGPEDADGDGYTNVEEFLNSIQRSR